MTSLVAQFGWTGHVALAAGGGAGHDRAEVRWLLIVLAAGGFRG